MKKKSRLSKAHVAALEIAKHLPKSVRRSPGPLYVSALPEHISKGSVFKYTVPSKNARVMVSYLYMHPGSEILDHMHTDEAEYYGEIIGHLPKAVKGVSCAGKMFQGPNPRGKRVAKCEIGESHHVTASKQARIIKSVKVTPPLEKPSRQQILNFEK